MTDPDHRRPRRTAQKEIVTSALRSEARFVSAQTLHRSLVDNGHGVGLATVYRQLNALVESGGADSIHVAETQMFRACNLETHHHHLVCESCGRAFEFDPPDETYIAEVAARMAFTPTRHIFEVFGLCQECGQA